MGLFWLNYHFVKSNSYEVQIHQVAIVSCGPHVLRLSLSCLICKTGIKIPPSECCLELIGLHAYPRYLAG